ncbi:hypothetical protein C8Q74DRAFT_732321 [Fomes fomentarius]|nr:hypothetical protein C8Q74DRAFT_732321 [Fomes fomentarius]
MADHVDFEVDDSALQNLLEPVLNFLSTVLPPPIFSIVSTLTTYSLALFTALARFVYSLASTQEWDSQKILPPLITLLMAYLALVSFYRTTGWMIRTTFWFVKWGGILATLAAGAGYFMGTVQGNGEGIAAFNGPGGVLGMLGSMLLGVLNEDNANSNSGRSRSTRRSNPRSGTSGPRTRSQKQKKEIEQRPKAWESWDKHRDWQYSADGAARDDAARANENVQEAVQKVAGYVQEALGRGWWETAKNVLEGSGLVGTSSEERKEGTQSKRKTKQDANGSGSSR